MINNKKPPCVLTIAGSDSSGGAGIQADIKTVSATGCYAASVITALTAQNTRGVQAVYALPDYFVKQQLESVFDDLNFDAIKIGMLFDTKTMLSVATALIKYKPSNIVLDPVMISKSGSELLKSGAIEYLKNHIFSLCSLITPNITEAEKLLEKEIRSESDMSLAATTLGEHYKTNILIKGGHLNSVISPDVLYSYIDAKFFWYITERLNTKNTHGTGCTLSSAIASFLAQDYSLNDAIAAAKNYLTNAIRFGSEANIGHGFGPVDHFYTIKEHSA